ncbi:endo-1,4-beta-xylanase [Spirosoma aerophilum]
MTLRQAAPFPLGVAVNSKLLATDSVYRNTVEREFNSLTSENALKMNRIHVAPDRFDWSQGDVIVNFARQTNKRMHGHTLVWHVAVPKWVETFQGDSLAWENLLKTHIQTVISHYKGKIRSWDVVNEAFNDDGSLRETIWMKHLGPDYIARCYQYAHEADPSVLLFYNDFSLDIKPLKEAAVKAMLVNFKRRGIPIDGVGLQAHISIYNSDGKFRDCLADMASTGLLIHISELDIRLNPKKIKVFSISDVLLKQQEQKYTAIVRAYRTAVPRKQQYGITIWSVGDKDSYLSNECKCPDAPLLFDSTYRKKLAYKGFMKALGQ